MLRRRVALALAAIGIGASGAAAAGMPAFCERGKEISPAEQDRVLRFAAVVKRELSQSGREVALIARAGLDLARFNLLYSHAGIVLKDADGGWSVRQLYYACDESRPRLFDQGVPGFALGADAPARGHVSLVFFDGEAGARLERAARDKPLALQLLAGRYSANAYAYGTRYQNCNQWVVELLASAWGQLPAGPAPRERAQSWLRAQGYEAGPVRIPSRWLLVASRFVPLLHLDDHPPGDLDALALHTSVPAAIEAFARAQQPGAQRVELCHDDRQIVVHRGWTALAPGCTPGPGDEAIPFDP